MELFWVRALPIAACRAKASLRVLSFSLARSLQIASSLIAYTSFSLRPMRWACILITTTALQVVCTRSQWENGPKVLGAIPKAFWTADGPLKGRGEKEANGESFLREILSSNRPVRPSLHHDVPKGGSITGWPTKLRHSIEWSPWQTFASRPVCLSHLSLHFLGERARRRKMLDLGFVLARSLRPPNWGIRSRENSRSARPEKLYLKRGCTI